jgi:AcrR family transcriptional regulator
MPGTRARRRKPAATYHHGDLRRALLAETARTIRKEGVDAVTLRAVGKRLGVSRTALYRHFADKPALLAAVAREGFQAFSRDLSQAWTAAGGGRAGFRAMGAAYVQFAIANPSHYRVMFGAFKDLCERDPELAADAHASFEVLLDAVTTLQADGLLRADPPETLAQYIWATVHGVAMLAIDGQLGPDPKAVDALARFALERLATSIAASPRLAPSP